jgi:hypothetical protein
VDYQAARAEAEAHRLETGHEYVLMGSVPIVEGFLEPVGGFKSFITDKAECSWECAERCLRWWVDS